jgi:Domain of unknown function (DUF1906).
MSPKWPLALLGVLLAWAACAAAQSAKAAAYVGFDRNDYPGDANLAALRRSFRFTGYWLNNPPGAQRNTWSSKRALLKKNGFGFLVLFNGRPYSELKGKDAIALGHEDGAAAVSALLREGFPRGTLIFLDQEEGGRLLQEQAEYIFAWADTVRSGGTRAGVYCSGIEVPDTGGTISTARDIVERETARLMSGAEGNNAQRLKLWIANDQCPPAPGCTLQHPPIGSAVPPELSASTLVWQYAQSPRRTQFTGGCPTNYAADNRCYAPGMAQGPDTFIDLNISSSPDPSAAQ